MITSDHTNCDTQREQDAPTLLFYHMCPRLRNSLRTFTHARSTYLRLSAPAPSKLPPSPATSSCPQTSTTPPAPPLPRIAPRLRTLTDRTTSVRRVEVGVGVLGGVLVCTYLYGIMHGGDGGWEVGGAVSVGEGELE